jgi:predicted ester cyclase
MGAGLTHEQQANVASFRRLIAEGFHGGRAEIVDEICAPDMVEHQDGFASADREGVKKGIQFLHALAPDIQVSVEAIDAVEDRVWARLRGRGTHGGTLMGGPTGRAFDITVMDLARFHEGRIVEHWGVPDRFAQMMQLGLLQVGPQPVDAPA